MKEIEKRDHQNFTKDLCKEMNRLTKYGNDSQLTQKWTQYKRSNFHQKLWFRDVLQCLRPKIEKVQASNSSFPEYLKWLHEDFPILSKILKYETTAKTLKYDFLSTEINKLIKSPVATRTSAKSTPVNDDITTPPVQ